MTPSQDTDQGNGLRAAFPELTIVVGRWAPDTLADDNPRLLSDAGATHVTTSLLEARDIRRQVAAAHGL
jgi:hypothetical protein